MRKFDKIFGVGLWKTGTTSLAKSLDLLGIRTLHNKQLYKKQREVESRSKLKPLSTIKGYKGFTDTPLEIDLWMRYYPNSLFIDTYRPLQDWLMSVEKHQAKYRRKFYYGKCMDSWFAWREKLEDTLYNKENFLSISICCGDGWDKLCEFLEVPIPEVSFPHEK